MPRKLFLHIGPHRTGSTYVQYVLANHPEALHRLGLYYPSLGIDTKTDYMCGQHAFVAWLAGFREYAGVAINFFKEEIENEIFNKTENIIISSETLANFNPYQMTIVKSYFKDFDIYVLYFARARADLLLSLWQHVVRWGATVDLPEFVTRHLLQWRQSKIVNPLGYLASIAQVFGFSNIILFNYDWIVRNKGDLINEMICALLDKNETAGVDLGIGDRINSSFRRISLEALRALNSVRLTDGEGPVTHAFIDSHLDSSLSDLYRATSDAVVKCDMAIPLSGIDEFFRVQDHELLRTFRDRIFPIAARGEAVPLQSRYRSLDYVRLYDLLQEVGSSIDIRAAYLDALALERGHPIIAPVGISVGAFNNLQEEAIASTFFTNQEDEGEPPDASAQEDVEIDLGAPISGAGWYEPERQTQSGGRAYRWTGPGLTFSITVPLARERSYLATVVMRPFKDLDWERLRVEIDDTDVSYHLQHEGDVTTVSFRVPPALTFQRSKARKLVFTIERTYRPSDFGGADKRLLGVAVQRISFWNDWDITG